VGYRHTVLVIDGFNYIYNMYIYIIIQYISYNIHSYTFIYIISTPNRWRTADWFGSVSNILKLLKSSAIDRNSNRFPFPSFTLCRPGAHVLPRAPHIFRSSPCSWNWPPYVSWRPPWSVVWCKNRYWSYPLSNLRMASSTGWSNVRDAAGVSWHTVGPRQIRNNRTG
jgi:hypothetical protein